MLSITFPCDGWTHSHESQTKIHVHSPVDGDDLLEVGRKIFQQVYTSWMANVSAPHQEPGWSQKGFDFPSNACSSENKLTCATHLTVTLIKIETYCSLVE